MENYQIVELHEIPTMTIIGHHVNEQWALCSLGQKPAGDGWIEPPGVNLNPCNGDTVGLIWKRPAATREEPVLFSSAAHVMFTVVEPEDTQPVPVEAFLQEEA